MRTLIITFAIAGVVVAIAWHSLLSFAAGALLVAPMIYATFRPNVTWLGPVVSRFETNAKEAWLTIDDGPTDDTPALLDLLDRCGVRATFFVKGVLAAAHSEWLRDIVARGHTIGNHSDTHPAGTFWCSPPNVIAREIDRCNAAIPPTKLFRAPVGFKNLFVHPALRKRGMQLVGFNVRAFDAVENDVEKIEARIMDDLAPGAIVLLHQGCEWSLRAIERTIESARAHGYSFVIPF